jgi:hypothetical protein
MSMPGPETGRKKIMKITHDMAGYVSEAIQSGAQSSANFVKRKKKARIYMVRHMLIRRSQLQPVTNAAAAGGKRMAICGGRGYVRFLSNWIV